MSRVLVLSFDPLTERMPGPAIRAWHLALELARSHRVVLAGTAGATRQHPSMDVIAVTGAQVDALVADADVVVAPGSVVRRHPAVTSKALCVDMYVPAHLENLEARGEADGPAHDAEVAHQVAVLNDDLHAGDFFICASERQRDFWLGSLASLGRINPLTYRDDPSLRSLIDVVPFGIDPATFPDRDRGALRALFPVIGPEDPVILWGGGVYNWFDPGSLVEAVDRLRRARPTLRLVFLGMQHPNPAIPEMRVASELRMTSDRMGLTGSAILFNQGWIPYDDRGAYLGGGDVGVSTHLPHIETRFSFRTRVLDYLWAGLPTVLTEGDTLSAEIAAAGVGMAVPPADAGALAGAIETMLARPPGREAVRAFGVHYAWPTVCEPVLRYVDEPRLAPDRTSTFTGSVTGSESSAPGAPSPQSEVRPPPPVAEEIAAVARDLGRLTGRVSRGAVRRLGRRQRPGPEE